MCTGTLSIIRTGHHQGCGWYFFNCSFQFGGKGRDFSVLLVKTYHVVSGGAAVLPLFDSQHVTLKRLNWVFSVTRKSLTQN